MPNRKIIKSQAKEVVHGGQVSAYRMTLLFLAIMLVFNGASFYVSGSYTEQVSLFGDIFGRSIMANFPSIPSFPPIVATFIGLLATLVGVVLSQGYSIYHLTIRRGESCGYTALFDGFTFVGKIILLFLAQVVLIALWSMLLVIPGIIAAYRYSFSFYNLCECPDLTVAEALRMSKQQTKGYKMDLFILDLSFIGWYLLSSLTLGILNIWLTPWVLQSQLGYFEIAKQTSGIGCRPETNPSSDI